MSTIFPSNINSLSGDGTAGWYHLEVTTTNRTDGTTDVLCELKYRRGTYFSSEANVYGSISVKIGDVSKALNIGDTITLVSAGDSWSTVYSETLNFRRSTETENAEIDVTDFKTRAFNRYANKYIWAIWVDTTGSSREYSYTLSLPDIALESKWTMYTDTVNTDSYFTGSIRRINAAYTVSASFKYGDTLLTTVAIESESISYKIPRSWMQKNKNAESIQVTVTLTTYSGETVIGTPEVRTLTVNADSYINLTITDDALTVAAVYTGINWIPGTVYIQSKCSIGCEYDQSNVSTARTQGATVKKWWVTVLGKDYEPGTSTDTEVTTGVINTHGNVTVALYVMDTRGRTVSVSKTVNVEQYTQPTLMLTSLKRCKADGTLDENGRYLSANLTAAGCSLSVNNDVTTTAIVSGVSYVLSNNTGVNVFGADRFDPDETIDVTLSVKDAFGGTTTVTKRIATRVWSMKFTVNGDGVAFGKAAEHSKTLQIPADWSFRIGDTTITGAQLAALLEMIT